RPLSSRLPRTPPPTPFPYTTLFRSDAPAKCAALLRWSKLWFAGTGATDAPECADPCPRTTAVPAPPTLLMDRPRPIPSRRKAARSEEHTSELQSRVDLVCRLLLEKK